MNPADQMVQRVKEFLYDAQGNLMSDGDKKFTYDAFNRAAQSETADGNMQVNHYDAENLRYETLENGRLVQFLFREREVVAEKGEDNVIRYVRDDYTIVASDCESARTYYHYASDELGSITHIINGENEVVNWYQYDAFGNTVACEEQVANRFRFCGQQWDPITGQYYLRARYYNPVIGRFTQEDTYRGDGLNQYAYCHGNPVTYWDPSGNMTQGPPCKAGQGANGENLPKQEPGTEHNDSTENSDGGKETENPLYKRGSFRKRAIAAAEAKAPRDEYGNMICPTCGQIIPPKITIETKNGPRTRRGYDLDHYPTTWNERVKEMITSDKTYTRKEVLDEYNKDIRVQCPPCNEGHQYEGIRGDFADGK